MSAKLESELQKIGLSEKEAKVYLAGLELGPSTAQSIAAKAVVNRPTTYVMIESLIKRGLMSSFEKGKKRFFVSGPPRQLEYIIDSKKREIEEQEKTLDSLKAYFQNVIQTKHPDPLVQVYEGKEATRVIQDILLANRDEVLELVPIDTVRKFIPPIVPGDVRERFSRQFKIKSLYSLSGGPNHSQKENVEYRYLSPDQYKFDVEVLILKDRAIITIFTDRQYSIHINNTHVATTLRILFMSLWEKADK